MGYRKRFRCFSLQLLFSGPWSRTRVLNIVIMPKLAIVLILGVLKLISTNTRTLIGQGHGITRLRRATACEVYAITLSTRECLDSGSSKAYPLPILGSLISQGHIVTRLRHVIACKAYANTLSVYAHVLRIYFFYAITRGKRETCFLPAFCVRAGG